MPGINAGKAETRDGARRAQWTHPLRLSTLWPRDGGASSH